MEPAIRGLGIYDQGNECTLAVRNWTRAPRRTTPQVCKKTMRRKGSTGLIILEDTSTECYHGVRGYGYA